MPTIGYPESKSMRIFLCHSSSDKPLVHEVANRLPKAIRGWIDEHEMKVGEDIRRTLAKAIKASDFMVPFISRASIPSEWVQYELQLALSQEAAVQRTIILPIIVESDKVVVGDLPAFLRDRRFLSLRDRSPSSVSTLVNRLAEDINSWVVVSSDNFITFLEHDSDLIG
jgi:hypothetical protein